MITVNLFYFGEGAGVRVGAKEEHPSSREIFRFPGRHLLEQE